MAKQTTALKKRTATLTQNSMTKWIAALAAIISIAISFTTVEPTISIRYLLLALFCLGFCGYFFLYKKQTVYQPYPILLRLCFLSGLLYFIWNAISLNFAINPAAGLYELLRHLLNMLLLFLFIEAMRREVDAVIMICKVILVVSMAHSIIGILQFYQLGFLNIPGANAMPYGLMANRNLYGSAQALTIPFVIFVLYAGNAAWRKAAIASLILLTISILLSQTRSAWLAAFTILAIGILLMLVFDKQNRKSLLKFSAAGFVSIIIIVAAVLFFNKLSGSSDSISERALSLAGASSAGTESSKNVNERFRIWKKTLQVIDDKKIWGTGLGNWKLAVGNYGTEGMPWENGIYVPDRAHNIYLQVLAESGIPGFILYAGIWLCIIIAGFSIVGKAIPKNEKVLLLLMIAGLGGFAMDSMFSFPAERIEHSFYLLLMCGIIGGIYLRTQPEQGREVKIKSPMLILFIVISIINIYMAYAKYNFESSLNIATAYGKEGNFAESIDAANSGKNTGVTIDPEGQTQEMQTGVAYKALKQYDNALSEMLQAKKYNPYSPLILTNIGTVYTDLKQYDKAVDYYKQALHYAPKFETVLINLAANEFELGHYQECLVALSKVNLQNYPNVVNLQNQAKAKLLK